LKEILCIFAASNNKKAQTMARYIKVIPTLKGEVAARFNEQAAEAENNRGSIDFSTQVEKARRILAKAKL